MVGGPEPYSKGSQARRCADCGELCYFSPSTRAKVAKIVGHVKYICMACIPDDSLSAVEEFNDEQIAEIHAAGIDMSKDQINAVMREHMKAFLGRKRKAE